MTAFTFGSGRSARTLPELIALCEEHPGEADGHLEDGTFGRWLLAAGRPGLAAVASGLQAGGRSRTRLDVFVAACRAEVNEPSAGGGQPADVPGMVVLDPPAEVVDLAFSPDGRYLAAAAGGAGLCVWDTRTWGATAVPLPGVRYAHRLAHAPAGDRLAVGDGSGDGLLRVLDTARWRELLTVPAHPRGAEFSSFVEVAFDPAGRRIATGGLDHAVRVWDAITGRELVAVARTWLRRRGHTAGLSAVVFDPSGDYLYTGSDDGTVRCWVAADGSELARLDTPAASGRLALSPDGGRLAAAHRGTVHLWSAPGWLELLRVTAYGDHLHAVRFSPDGRRLAAAGGLRPNAPGTLQVWDAVTGDPVWQPDAPFHQVNCLAFSPDGRLLAAADWEKVRVWTLPAPAARPFSTRGAP